MMKLLLRSLPAAALFAVLLAGATAGAQDASLRATVSSVETGEYPDARVVLNVEDRSGAALGALTPASFTILVDGVEAEVSAAELVSSSTTPLDVLLMLDTSGSTEGPTLAAAKAAAVAFIQNLAPEDRVAVMRFANSVTVQQDFTTDKSAAIAAINGLVSRGQTELYKAAAGAINQAVTSTSSRRAIVFLTDGSQDTIVTDVTAAQATSVAASTGIPVYTIAVGAAIEDSSFVQDLARVSGGSYLEAPTVSDLSAVYESVGRLLQNQYVVTFDGAAAAGKPQSVVAVTVRSGSRSAAAEGILVPAEGFIAPSLTVAGINPGEMIEDPREVTVTAGAETIESVSFLVDGVNVFETDAAPFTFTYDPDRYGEGEHTFRVSATIGGRPLRSEPVTFSSIPATPIEIPTGDEGGGGLPVLPIASVAGLAALVALAWFVVNRVRRASIPELKIASADQRVTPWAARHRSVSAPVLEDAPEVTAVPAQEIGEALGVLISRSGSDAGTEYEVGAKPVSIGYGRSCAIRIDDAALATEEARIWIRKDHLMYHRLSRLTSIANEGVVGGWQMLDPGESFRIGEHLFEFRLLPEHAPDTVKEDAPSQIPNILRDREPSPAPEQPSASPTPVMPQPGLTASDPPRLTEMMPREMGFPYQDTDDHDLDDPAAQAS